MKTRRNWKWRIPHMVLGTWTMCFSSYKNCELKVKLWCERKKSALFVKFILSERNFFKTWVLSQSIAYWINFQNIYTFTYQKILLHTFLLLVFKIVESRQCILKPHFVSSSLQFDWNWDSTLHSFFISNTFISNTRLKLAKNQAKSWATPEMK